MLLNSVQKRKHCAVMVGLDYNEAEICGKVTPDVNLKSQQK